ncbi:MAG: hypothetical protein MUP03_01100 [Anaerolineales bacterium]|nr:hypothetical protein [Anaerolineales bacterium]
MFRDKLLISILIAGVFFSLLTAGCKPGQPASTQAPAPTLKPRLVPQKPLHTEIDMGTFSGVIVIKFVEGSDIRLRAGKLVSLSNGSVDELDELFARFPLDALERQFSQPEDQLAREQAALETETGEDMADLNLYFRLTLKNKADGAALIDALNALPIVELAYPEPAPAPPPQ